MKLYSTLSVQELFKNKLISRAAYTICCREQFTDLAAIALYQSRFKNFLRLKNCGDTTNEGLVSLCREWARVSGHQKDQNAEEARLRALTPAERWEEQTREQQQDAENRYQALRGRLSKRAGNKLLALCAGNVSSEALAAVLSTHLTSKQQILLSPDNASGAELLSFVREFTGYLEKPRSSRDARTGLLALLRSRMSRFVPSHPVSPMGRFLKEEFGTLETGHFPLLHFAHLFLQGCLSLPQNLKQAFLQSASWYTGNSKESKEAVAARFGYTVQSLETALGKEKIKQKLLHSLKNAVALLQPFGFVVPAAFTLSGKFQRFRETGEESPFSGQFVISFILLLNPAYQAVRVWIKHESAHVFLPKEVAERFNATGFSASVNKALAKKIPVERVLPLHALAAPFYKQVATQDESSEVLSVASLLLQHLYHLSPDTEGYIHLPPTRAKFITEHMHDILTEQNKPCHIRDIVLMLHQKGLHASVENLRSGLKLSNRFMVMGSSIYGLKEWEKKGSVGGTIKQLMKKFLTEAGEPKHVQEIANWVMMHRNTSAESIRTNIQHDPKGWFRFFGNGFYGLAGVRYKKARYKRIDAGWLTQVKLLYAKAGSDQLPKSTVADFVADRYSVTPAQVERLLSKHISKGTIKMNDDYLLLFLP